MRRPIPAALLALWQETAGCSLDYDLTLAMDSHQEAISWTELFFNSSNAYRDLQGWIEAEQELADALIAFYRRALVDWPSAWPA